MWRIIKIYITDMLTMIGVVIFGKETLKETLRTSKISTFINFQLICILQIISFILFEGTLKTLIMILNNILFYKCIYKISISKAALTSFFCMLLFVVVDILEIMFLTNIIGMSKIYYYNNFAGSIIANIMTVILFTVAVIILKKPLRKIINTELNVNVKIIFLFMFTLISILLFGYSLVKTFKFSNNILEYLIAIFVLIIVLFNLIKQTLINTKITKEYDELLKYMTTFENEIEKQRILRHETKNEFLTIRAKICDNQENKEIVGYIDEILKEKIKVKQEEYAKFGYLPPNGIKGLCYFKVQEAEEKNIKVALNISKRIKSSTIYDLDTKQQKDFARILGVILDNAIEASEVSHKKQIGIEAYMNTNKEFKMIISNTYNNKIDKNKIGHERASTKGKNRGHGLLLVKHIINKNNILKLKTEIQNEIYIQTIIVKKV